MPPQKRTYTLKSPKTGKEYKVDWTNDEAEPTDEDFRKIISHLSTLDTKETPSDIQKGEPFKAGGPVAALEGRRSEGTRYGTFGPEMEKTYYSDIPKSERTRMPAPPPEEPKVEDPNAGYFSRLQPGLEGLGHFAKNIFIAGAFPQGNTPEIIKARQEIGQGAIEPFKELARTDRMMSPEGTPLIPEFAKFSSGLAENVGRFATGFMGGDYDTLDYDVKGFQKDPSWRGARAIAGDLTVPTAMALAPKAIRTAGAIGKAGARPIRPAPLPFAEPPPVIRGVRGIDPAAVETNPSRMLPEGPRTPTDVPLPFDEVASPLPRTFQEHPWSQPRTGTPLDAGTIPEQKARAHAGIDAESQARIHEFEMQKSEAARAGQWDKVASLDAEILNTKMEASVRKRNWQPPQTINFSELPGIQPELPFGPGDFLSGEMRPTPFDSTPRGRRPGVFEATPGGILPPDRGAPPTPTPATPHTVPPRPVLDKEGRPVFRRASGQRAGKTVVGDNWPLPEGLIERPEAAPTPVRYPEGSVPEVTPERAPRQRTAVEAAALRDKIAAQPDSPARTAILERLDKQILEEEVSRSERAIKEAAENETILQNISAVDRAKAAARYPHIEGDEGVLRGLKDLERVRILDKAKRDAQAAALREERKAAAEAKKKERASTTTAQGRIDAALAAEEANKKGTNVGMFNLQDFYEKLRETEYGKKLADKLSKARFHIIDVETGRPIAGRPSLAEARIYARGINENLGAGAARYQVMDNETGTSHVAPQLEPFLTPEQRAARYKERLADRKVRSDEKKAALAEEYPVEPRSMVDRPSVPAPPTVARKANVPPPKGRGHIPSPDSFQDPTARTLAEQVAKHDKLGSPDEAYRRIISFAKKEGLKPGETWRGRVVRLIENQENAHKQSRGTTLGSGLGGLQDLYEKYGPQLKDATARRWAEIVDDLEGAADSEFRAAMPPILRNDPLKAGETWKGRFLAAIDERESKVSGRESQISVEKPVEFKSTSDKPTFTEAYKKDSGIGTPLEDYDYSQLDAELNAAGAAESKLDNLLKDARHRGNAADIAKYEASYENAIYLTRQLRHLKSVLSIPDIGKRFGYTGKLGREWGATREKTPADYFKEREDAAKAAAQERASRKITNEREQIEHDYDAKTYSEHHVREGEFKQGRDPKYRAENIGIVEGALSNFRKAIQLAKEGKVEAAWDTWNKANDAQGDLRNIVGSKSKIQDIFMELRKEAWDAAQKAEGRGTTIGGAFGSIQPFYEKIADKVSGSRVGKKVGEKTLEAIKKAARSGKALREEKRISKIPEENRGISYNVVDKRWNNRVTRQFDDKAAAQEHVDRLNKKWEDDMYDIKESVVDKTLPSGIGYADPENTVHFKKTQHHEVPDTMHEPTFGYEVHARGAAHFRMERGELTWGDFPTVEQFFKVGDEFPNAKQLYYGEELIVQKGKHGPEVIRKKDGYKGPQKKGTTIGSGFGGLQDFYEKLAKSEKGRKLLDELKKAAYHVIDDDGVPISGKNTLEEAEAKAAAYTKLRGGDAQFTVVPNVETAERVAPTRAPEVPVAEQFDLKPLEPILNRLGSKGKEIFNDLSKRFSAEKEAGKVVGEREVISKVPISEEYKKQPLGQFMQRLRDNMSAEALREIRIREWRADKLAEMHNVEATGEAGLLAKLNIMKGAAEAPPTFKPLKMSQTLIDQLIDLADKHYNTGPGRDENKAIRAGIAIRDLNAGKYIAPEPRNLLSNLFPEQYRKEIMNMYSGIPWEHIQQYGAELAPPIKGFVNKTLAQLTKWTWRSMDIAKATGDMSFAFNQGRGSMGHASFYKSRLKTLKAMFDQAEFDRQQKARYDSPWWSIITEDMGVHIGDLELLGLDQFRPGRRRKNNKVYGNPTLEKSPLVLPFHRGALALLNDIKFRNAEILAKAAIKRGDNLADPKVAKSIGAIVNEMAGHGSLTEGLVKAEETIRLGVWSPRLTAQKFNYGKLFMPSEWAKEKRFAQKQRARSLATWMVSSVALMEGLRQLGGKPTYDLAASNFGKVEFEDQIIDTTSGMGSAITLAYRLATGRVVDTKGKTHHLYSSEFGQSATELIGSFFENKASPKAAFIAKLVRQENPYTGKPYNIPAEAINSMLPMFAENFIDAVKDLGSSDPDFKRLLFLLPSFTGLNVYNKDRKRSTFGEDVMGLTGYDKKRKQTFREDILDFVKPVFSR